MVLFILGILYIYKDDLIPRKDPDFIVKFKSRSEEFQSFDDFSAAVDAALLKFPAIQKNRNKHDKAKQFESAETQANIEIVKALLECVDPDLEYCQWRNLVWSVAATGWECSYEIARSWSANGDSWKEGAFN